jgi:toxin ParE1/3/4
MRIRWTPSAADDLEQIYAYLTEHQPQWVRPTVIEIRDAIRVLKKFPHQGRRGREDGTRELVHDRLPFVIAYRIKDDAIEILHIWHAAQDR